MKKSELKQIIKEEIRSIIKEDNLKSEIIEVFADLGFQNGPLPYDSPGMMNFMKAINNGTLLISITPHVKSEDTGMFVATFYPDKKQNMILKMLNRRPGIDFNKIQTLNKGEIIDIGRNLFQLQNIENLKRMIKDIISKIK